MWQSIRDRIRRFFGFPDHICAEDRILSELNACPCDALTLGRRLKMTSGTVYIALGRLMETGHVATAVEEVSENMPDDYVPRRLYWLTEKGRYAVILGEKWEKPRVFEDEE